MNVELLRRVQKAIREEPKRMNMHTWINTDPHDNPPICGTTACIAGWAAILSHQNTDESIHDTASNLVHWDVHINRTAGVALELDSEQRARLFFIEKWPAEFHNGPDKMAEDAIARIEHFIKTEGRE